MGLLEGVLAAALSIPAPSEDRLPEVAEAKHQQIVAVSNAVTSEAQIQKVAAAVDWAALMLAVIENETNGSLRIHRGECRWDKRECDAIRGPKGERIFRARGLMQQHAYNEAARFWEHMIGVENTELQMRIGSIALVRGYYTCRGKTDWLIATINGFAGRDCAAIWSGLEARAKSWRRLRGVIQRASKNRPKEQS
jgi:hypothetical protein